MLKWILVGIGICLYWTIEGLHLLYKLLTGGDAENSRKTKKTKVLKYWWCWQWETMYSVVQFSKSAAYSCPPFRGHACLQCWVYFLMRSVTCYLHVSVSAVQMSVNQSTGRHWLSSKILFKCLVKCKGSARRPYIKCLGLEVSPLVQDKYLVWERENSSRVEQVRVRIPVLPI